MTTPIAALSELLRTMNPELHKGVYVFASLPHGSSLTGLNPLATFREKEGISVILPESDALRAQAGQAAARGRFERLGDPPR